MNDILLVIVIAVLLIPAFYGSLAHFKGEGDCCGGGSVKVPKKKLKNRIVESYTVKIEGMHCDHCAAKVASAINGIEHASAMVRRAKGTASVRCDEHVEKQLIRKQIEQAGYRVISITD